MSIKYNRSLFKFNSKKARKQLEQGGYPLLDHYNGRLVYQAHQWQAEHALSLREAWEYGFKQQYAVNPRSALINMKRFANDMDNLIVVSGSSNMSRGSLSIYEFLPLNLAFVPVINAKYRILENRYGLQLPKRVKRVMKFSDRKILEKYKNGIRLNKVRAWLITHGFHRFLMPF